MTQNPRDILGVDHYATIEECRKAYRALAKKHHPDVDRTPGARERMAAINAAWELVQKLPQPQRVASRPAASGPVHPWAEDPLFARRGRGTPPRPHVGKTTEELEADMTAAIEALRAAMGGQGWTSNTSATNSFFGARWRTVVTDDIPRAEMPQWPDGSLKVTAADFTGDACDFRMPGGLYEGNRLGDILRDHEWYGEEIDQYPIGDPIRSLFKSAKDHLEREKRGRPIHEW